MNQGALALAAKLGARHVIDASEHREPSAGVASTRRKRRSGSDEAVTEQVSLERAAELLPELGATGVRGITVIDRF